MIKFTIIQQLIKFPPADTIGMGKRDEVDSFKHVITTITGYGLLAAENAMY